MKRLLFLLLTLSFPILALAAPDPNPARFEKEIVAFDAADAKSPLEKGGIVFTGSSSIRLLDLKKVFPGLKALNRGFGGSHISDVNHYLDRCLLRYEPSLVVFYCAGNDLWDKKTPEQVEEDFAEFQRRLPDTSAGFSAVSICGTTQDVANGGDGQTRLSRDFLDGYGHGCPRSR